MSKKTCVHMNYFYLALQHVWIKWSFLYEELMELCSISHFIAWFFEKNVLKTLMSFLKLSHINSLFCCSCRSGGHINNTSWGKLISLFQFQSFEFFQFFVLSFHILSFVRTQLMQKMALASLGASKFKAWELQKRLRKIHEVLKEPKMCLNLSYGILA